MIIMNFSEILPTFVVTLREGFEAALVVGIVLACLQKAQLSSLNRWVYQGIVAGVVASLLLGIALASILKGVDSYNSPYTPVIKEILASLFGLIAIGMLSWMLIWMTQQARYLKSDIENELKMALSEGDNGARGVFLLIFIAVLREGFETVLFILAKFQQDWTLPTVGAIGGLVSAGILGFLLFKVGIKVDIRRFFQVMGILLLLIVGGLVISWLIHADTAILLLSRIDPYFASWCKANSSSCFLGSKVWDFSQILPDKQFPGILLKSLFGYRQVLYWGQAIAYFLFMTLLGTLYFQSLQGQKISRKQEIEGT